MSTKPLRIAYGLALVFLLFIPFGVYHFRTESDATGVLWGYYLPIGHFGLALGLLMIVFPKLALSRRLRFGSLMIIAGLVLLLIFIVSPKDYFINLLHNTNLSLSLIDVDYAVGNVYVWVLSLFSIAIGIILRVKSRILKNNSK